MLSRAETDECILQPKIPVGAIPDWQPKPSDPRRTVRRNFAVRFKDKPTVGCTMAYSAHGFGEMPQSYAAAFILNQQRIRGIDYTPVRNMHLFREKEVRNAGWHENIRYFNESIQDFTNDHTAYTELSGFNPQTLEELFQFSCARWNIEIPETERRLL